jgi:type IV secretory pathway VirB10-like protein
MIQMNEAAEKKDRMEFLTANAGFMEKAVALGAQAGPAAPVIVPLIMEMWKFGVTAFKVGKTIEGQFDEAADKLKEMAKNPPPAPPNPEMAKVQAEAQATQRDQQMEAQRQQQEAQAREREMQLEAAARQRELQMEAAMEAHRGQMEAQRGQQETMMNAQFERFKALLEARTKIEVAEIAAGATLEAAQIKGAKEGTDA